MGSGRFLVGLLDKDLGLSKPERCAEGVRPLAIALFLIAFFGFTLSAPFSLGKLLAVSLCGVWLALGRCRRLGVWPLFYIASIVLTTWTSPDLQVSALGLWGTYNTGLLCALSLVPFWTHVGAEDRVALERGIRWGALLMVAVGLCQKFGVALLTPYPLPTGERVYSTLGSPIYVGAVGALCMPFCKSLYERGLLIALLWATGSRGAWLAVAIGAIYEAWPQISARLKLWGMVATGGGLIAAMTLRPPSDLGRIAVWAAAWDAFKARPWLGWGAGNYLMVAELYRNPLWEEVYGKTTQDHAHNIFLEAMAQSGIVGLVALCGLLCSLWMNTRECRTTRAALLGCFIVGLLNPLPMVAKALALMLAATCAEETRVTNRALSSLYRALFLGVFFVTAFLVHCDRLVTFYGAESWSFSSVKAAYRAGIIKEVVERRRFKL